MNYLGVLRRLAPALAASLASLCLLVAGCRESGWTPPERSSSSDAKSLSSDAGVARVARAASVSSLASATPSTVPFEESSAAAFDASASSASVLFGSGFGDGDNATNATVGETRFDIAQYDMGVFQ